MLVSGVAGAASAQTPDVICQNTKIVTVDGIDIGYRLTLKLRVPTDLPSMKTSTL
jgi:hypothetical protein